MSMEISWTLLFKSKLFDAGETVECHKHVQDVEAIENSWYHNKIYILDFIVNAKLLQGHALVFQIDLVCTDIYVQDSKIHINYDELNRVNHRGAIAHSWMVPVLEQFWT